MQNLLLYKDRTNKTFLLGNKMSCLKKKVSKTVILSSNTDHNVTGTKP